VRTKSRAEAASALDQVKTARTTNQQASSGKCVWIAWGSMAPAACINETKLASCSGVGRSLEKNEEDCDNVPRKRTKFQSRSKNCPTWC
jgi:hypothetical protein